jgi:hypothetical protein
MSGVTREALLAQIQPAFAGDAEAFVTLLAAAGVADKQVFSAAEAGAIAVALGDLAARQAESAIAALEALEALAEAPEDADN